MTKRRHTRNDRVGYARELLLHDYMVPPGNVQGELRAVYGVGLTKKTIEDLRTLVLDQLRQLEMACERWITQGLSLEESWKAYRDADPDLLVPRAVFGRKWKVVASRVEASKAVEAEVAPPPRLEPGVTIIPHLSHPRIGTLLQQMQAWVASLGNDFSDVNGVITIQLAAGAAPVATFEEHFSHTWSVPADGQKDPHSHDDEQ